MRRFLRQKDRTPVLAQYRDALTREIILTEQSRVKAVIITVSLLVAVTTMLHVVAPSVLARISHGQFDLTPLYAVYVPFVLFEFMVLYLLARRLKMQGDVPWVRRYLSALIETSIPTFVLYLHMNWMGPEQALGFAAPLAYFLFIILSTLRLDFWLSTFTGFVAAAELFVMAMLYHPAGVTGISASELGYELIRSVMFLIGGILAGSVGVQLRHQFETSIAAATARDRVTNLFGQHVSPAVVERLLVEGADSSSHIRHVAVMFVDFRSFTAGARIRTPQEVVERLDGAFAILVEILDRHGGIVNKFLGDGFLALFGAPIESSNAAREAVAAGREMLAAMDEVNEASSWPLRIGIGIHYGEVVAGNIGSPRRKEYTVIGDTVNFASRLETLNKDFNSQLLISSAVYEAVGEASRDAVSLGPVTIKGYDRPMPVWQLG
ncbi:adenylate/guanylate cyclase domain-containing protein [Bradyrhizobium canariense]|uniref:adenylate/guanylate cyclase domain-containing protein n=1 Tax=Bradyrhizobium canariense TaxID=255045 RepID=UPI001FCE1B1E|nr:adenylate/guanylate cyclase domain-containing protein [Bradyrhizobium canariense]